jgi:hypothetical protein
MADIIALRAQLDGDKVALVQAQQKLQALEDQLANDQGDVPPTALMFMRRQVMAQAEVVHRIQGEVDAAQAAYAAAAQADPMHGTDAGLPLVLLPVRLETAFLLGASGGTDLAVRVYPDDVHVDSHEPELTPNELAAATAYWQAVWGAGSNTDRLNNAWNAVMQQLKPSRAAWAVDILTPSAPRPTDETPLGQPQPVPTLPTVPGRSSTFTRAPQTTLLPDHWSFIGFQGGNELFNVDGGAIPDALKVSFGPPGTGAESSDLPFDAGSRWLVDLDAAISAGMAVRIPLTGPNFNIDQLFVLGVSARLSPADAAARLESALVAHQYTSGLGFLPPGSPTNNTASVRSAWQSAPQPPAPADVAAARAAYSAGSNQNAARIAAALGIDGSAALSSAPHGLDDQQTPVTVLQSQLWTVFGGRTLSMLYNQWDIPAGKDPSEGGWVLHNDPAGAAALQEHSNGWVRSRGILPVLRIANQPYGLLPASSLAYWVTASDDPTNQLIQWLRVFRQYWLAAVMNVPAITDGDPQPDTTIVNVLSRQPVSESLMIRQDGDPVSQEIANQPFPIAPIPGLPTSSELFLAAPGATAIPSPVPFVSDPAGDQKLLLLVRDLLSDSIDVLNTTMVWQDWANKYQPLFGSNTFPGAPPPDLFTSMIKDSLSDPLVGPNEQTVVGIVFGAFAYQQKKDDPTFQQAIQALLPKANAFLAQYELATTVDPSQYDPVLREIFDIFSHRYDAWVTSLAARRLDQLRAAKPVGAAVGAYGWVENLSPRTDLSVAPNPPAGFDSVFTSDKQKYIHAPSLHHAATAAVLRAGYESHAHPDSLAVNLVSSRVRIADWLAEGIRNGQTLGALLGYRFERALHEAGLDVLIEKLRQEHPLPLPSSADGDANGGTARQTIVERNVVDGLDLYHQQGAVRAEYAATPQIGMMLDDLANAIDALGDLLLAESVHHLVGGNPLRAGLAADTIGRGEPVPDRFDVVRTPRAGRALSWQVAALLPSAWRSDAAGWRSDRPRASMEPHLESWAQTVLGAATSWKIHCSVTTNGTTTDVIVGLDSLELCALDVISESAGNPALLGSRIIDSMASSQPAGAQIAVVGAPAADATLGFGELCEICARLRALLGKATALGPQHVIGPSASPAAGLDVAELQNRVTSFKTSFSNAANQLSVAMQALNTAATGSDSGALQTAVEGVRAALVTVADHGVPSAYPPAIASDLTAAASSFADRASAVLAAIAPLQAVDPPSPPASDAPAADFAQWFRATTDYVQGIAGKIVPLTASYQLQPDSAYAKSFAPESAPSGSDETAVMAWLRRLARVRPNCQAVHDLLLANEAFLEALPAITVAQLPVSQGEQWIGLPFDQSAPAPGARLCTVALTPAPVDVNAEFCGLLFDNWTEQLPGLTSVTTADSGYEAAEVTGVSFTVETPDAYPPQSILLAIAPDQSWGWSLDVLLDVVKETLELAKVRMVDLGDLLRLGRVLPALHTTNNVDTMLSEAGVK